MTWQAVLQSLTVIMASIGAWFLYDLVREFKIFKNETKNDIFELKNERLNFQSEIQQASLGMQMRSENLRQTITESVGKLSSSMNQIHADTMKVEILGTKMSEQVGRHEEFLQKSFQLHKALGERLERQAHEIRSFKIQLENITIIKGK